MGKQLIASMLNNIAKFHTGDIFFLVIYLITKISYLAIFIPQLYKLFKGTTFFFLKRLFIVYKERIVNKVIKSIYCVQGDLEHVLYTG